MAHQGVQGGGGDGGGRRGGMQQCGETGDGGGAARNRVTKTEREREAPPSAAGTLTASAWESRRWLAGTGARASCRRRGGPKVGGGRPAGRLGRRPPRPPPRDTRSVMHGAGHLSPRRQQQRHHRPRRPQQRHQQPRLRQRAGGQAAGRAAGRAAGQAARPPPRRARAAIPHRAAIPRRAGRVANSPPRRVERAAAPTPLPPRLTDPAGRDGRRPRAWGRPPARPTRRWGGWPMPPMRGPSMTAAPTAARGRRGGRCPWERDGVSARRPRDGAQKGQTTARRGRHGGEAAPPWRSRRGNSKCVFSDLRSELALQSFSCGIITFILFILIRLDLAFFPELPGAFCT